jgi:hypothetical protein
LATRLADNLGSMPQLVLHVESGLARGSRLHPARGFCPPLVMNPYISPVLLIQRSRSTSTACHSSWPIDAITSQSGLCVSTRTRRIRFGPASVSVNERQAGALPHRPASINTMPSVTAMVSSTRRNVADCSDADVTRKARENCLTGRRGGQAVRFERVRGWTVYKGGVRIAKCAPEWPASPQR